MSKLTKELSSDLEAQKSDLLYDHDDPKGAGIRVTGEEIFEKPTSTLALDSTIKPSQTSSQTSFLVWTIINTLATIGIVKKPLL